jgi:hypothetical protein
VIRATIDRNIVDPQRYWPFVAFVLLAFATERRVDITSHHARKPTAPQTSGRRRRDIRPPRAC